MKLQFNNGVTIDIANAYFYNADRDMIRIDINGNVIIDILKLFEDTTVADKITVLTNSSQGDTVLATYSDYSILHSVYLETDGDMRTTVILKSVSMSDKLNICEMKIGEIEKHTGMRVDTAPMTLDELKEYMQSENNKMLADFLRKSCVEYNGGVYGVTLEDQQEMALNFTQFRLLGNEKLEWHEKSKECREITVEEFIGISGAIKQFVYPYYRLNQMYKEAIYNCATKEDVLKVELSYE